MTAPYEPAVRRLLDRMDLEVRPELYPETVIQVPKDKIPGTAFFPGGSGLYLENRDLASVIFPKFGVMILGHNFDSECGFCCSYHCKKEDLTKGTWAGILKLLNKAGVPVQYCFFTNGFMGLCKGRDNKNYQGRTDQKFREGCLAFLKAQVEEQQPRLIVTLGAYAPVLLGAACTGLENLMRTRNHKDPKVTIEDMEANSDLTAHFDGISDAVVVPITHPGDRRNTITRHPKGRSYEAKLIQEGWEQSKKLGGQHIHDDRRT